VPYSSPALRAGSPVKEYAVRRRDYYRRWLSIAFVHSWTVTDTIASALGLAVPALTKLFPDRGDMSDLAWQIPLCALGAIFLSRLVLAPWWIHQEQEQGHAANTKGQQQTHDAVVKSYATLRAEVNADPATADDVAEEFRLLTRQARKFLERGRPLYSESDAKQWIERAKSIVKLTLRSTYSDELTSIIDCVYNADDGFLQMTRVLNEVATWLSQWDGRLTKSQIRPECTQAMLLAATATQS
jgi:hypothetical protein